MKPRTRQLIGEFCREVAALVLVFVPLDFLMISELTGRTIVLTLILSGALLTCGILLDGGRTSDNSH